MVRNVVKLNLKPILSILVPFLLFHTSLFAQTRDEHGAIKALRDSIRVYDDDLELLQHFLEASTVDQRNLQHANVKKWIIGNPALRDSLFYALLSADSSLESEAGADAVVLATDSDDLLEIRFGTAVFKGMTLKRALDRFPERSLYRRIAYSYQYSRDIELRDPTFRLDTPLQPELLPYEELLREFNPGNPQGEGGSYSGYASLSLFDLSVRVGPAWGGQVRLGVDEIDNPFWINGTATFLASYDRVHFGLVLPVSLGRNNADLFPPLLLQSRKFSGGRGVFVDFDLGSVGGLFSVTRFSRGDIGTATDPSSFDYVAGILQLYYSFGLSFDPHNFVRTKVGAGIHRITHASLVHANPGAGIAEDYIGIGENTNLAGPYIRIEYLNRSSSDNFRIGIQFYNVTFLFTGSFQIISDVLALEAKYVWPVGGPLRVWDTPGFLMVSPKIHITF
jgi:hypothetical protein